MGQPHLHRIRVRYAESDQMGFAHHGNYATWFEEARIELLRAVGHSYRQLEESGITMPVVSLQVQFQRALRFDDEAELRTSVRPPGRASITFVTEIWRGSDHIATGEVTIAAVDATGKPMRLPPVLSAALLPHQVAAPRG